MEEKKKRKKLYKKSIEKKFLKERFEFRLSKAELIILKEKADEAGLKTSQYVRRKVLEERKGAFNPKELIDNFFKYTGAINKVGVNINQATNYLNYLKIQGKGSEKEIKEFNNLFYRYLELLEDINYIMKREFKKL